MSLFEGLMSLFTWNKQATSGPVYEQNKFLITLFTTRSEIESNLNHLDLTKHLFKNLHEFKNAKEVKNMIKLCDLVEKSKQKLEKTNVLKIHNVERFLEALKNFHELLLDPESQGEFRYHDSFYTKLSHDEDKKAKIYDLVARFFGSKSVKLSNRSRLPGHVKNIYYYYRSTVVLRKAYIESIFSASLDLKSDIKKDYSFAYNRVKRL